MAQMDTFEPSRFMGKWYLIARYRNRSESSYDSAIFEYLPILGSTNEFSVIKTCYSFGSTQGREDELGEWNLHPSYALPGLVTFHPLRKLLNVKFENTPGHLKTIVLWTDYDTLAILSSGHDHFWILSRTPTITKDQFEFLQEKTRKLGYMPDLAYLTENGRHISE